MSDPVQRYEKGSLVVTFDPKVCTHSARCVRGLAAVFDVKRRPWVDLEGAEVHAVVAQVAQCPSGALQVERKETP